MRMVLDSVKETKVNESECEGEDRKWSKPVMEKRRRERINRSLEELKRLVLEAQHRDCSRYTKLEKADILEMTVKHLRTLRRQQKTALSSSPLLSTYRAGCSSCVSGELTQYMTTGQASVGHPRTRHTSCCNIIQNNTAVGLGREQANLQHTLAVPAAMDQKDNNEPTQSAPHTVGPPTFVCQAQHSLGAVPVRFVPIFSSDPCTLATGLPQTVFQTAHPVGYSVRDPLWRPF